MGKYLDGVGLRLNCTVLLIMIRVRDEEVKMEVRRSFGLTYEGRGLGLMWYTRRTLSLNLYKSLTIVLYVYKWFFSIEFSWLMKGLK